MLIHLVTIYFLFFIFSNSHCKYHSSHYIQSQAVSGEKCIYIVLTGLWLLFKKQIFAMVFSLLDVYLCSPCLCETTFSLHW